MPVRTAALLGVSDGAVKRYTADGIRALNSLLGTQAAVDDHTVQILTSQRSGHDA